jgi:cephalosporin hydroxylase
MLKTLQQIWDELPMKSDKGNVHSYLEVYEEILAPYRETANNILEIGLFNGASIRMWAEYFDNKTEIYGIDCSLTPHGGMADLQPLIDEQIDGVDIQIFDAENKEEVSKRFSGIKFDVIIEDAGHEINQQLNLYKIWKPYIAEGGIYVIEDIQDFNIGIKRIIEEIDEDVEIFDRRSEKGRYDDILIVIK